MTDDAFSEQVWKVQLEVAKLCVMMDELRLNHLSVSVVGKEYDWVFYLSHTPDHADDERRAAHGN